MSSLPLSSETSNLKLTISHKSELTDIKGSSLPPETYESSTARQATLLFLCSAAYEQAFPTRSLNILSSYKDGVYCQDYQKPEPFEEEDLVKLRSSLENLIRGDSELKLFKMPRKDYIEFLERKGENDKLKIMKLYRNDPIDVAQIDSYIDYVIEPLTQEKHKLALFEINKLSNGFVVRYSLLSSPHKLLKFADEPALVNIIKEYREWQGLVKCSTIPELNSHIIKGSINEIKWISENLHNKKLFDLSREIIGNYPTKRVLTLAGPSSSNKTTVSLRLGLSLQAMGFKTLVISMDDYYKPWAEIEKDEEGKYNFEDLAAINLEAIRETFHVSNIFI